MASKSGYFARYENLAKDLIRDMLEFEDDDKNFSTSMDYVMSNLLYHHYLDVNDHQIRRLLQGISFKMIIHGHQKKAEQLQALIDKFLVSPALQDKGDLKWSILSLLNELSHHPARDSLSASFVDEIQSSLETSVKKDSVETEWLAELMDRSYHLQDKEETLSEWSDDDEMKLSFSAGAPSTHSQHQTAAKGRETVTSLEMREITPSKREEMTSSEMGEREKRNALAREAHLASSWLSNNLHHAYWIGDERRGGGVGSSVNGSEGVQLTEYVIMRECLWLLQHPSSGYIFQQKEDMFNIRPISMASLKQVDLHSILQSFSSAASKLFAIDKWMKDVEFLSKTGSSGTSGHLGTFISYSDGLRKWRSYFNKEVNLLEKQIFCQEGCQTLLWLLDALQSPFSNLSVIYDIHKKTFASPNEPLQHKSLKLLSLLIQGVVSGIKKEDQKCLLILFLHALKSCLKSIYTLLWGMGAPRADLLEEFGIIRNRNITASSDSNFLLQSMNHLNLPGLNFLSILRQPLLQICELREVVQNLLFEEDIESDYLGKLVEEEILSKYFRANESMTIESTANESTCVNLESNNNLDESKTTLSEHKIENWFKESFESKIIERSESSNKEKLTFNNNLESNDLKLESISEECSASQKINQQSTTKEKKLESKYESTEIESFQFFTEDILLRKAFEEDDPSSKTDDEKSPYLIEGFHRSLGLEHLLSNVLLPVVQNRYKGMGIFLLRSLVERNGLKQQLKIFTSIVLLDPNVYMNEFYSFLFNKISCKEPLEEWDLTQSLRFCVGLSNPDFAPFFSITFQKRGESKSKTSSFSTEDILSSIGVEFTDLWPLCIIVKSNHLIKYNNIFKFCLLLRRASYTVERLHFKEIVSYDSCYENDGSINASDIKDENICRANPLDSPEDAHGDMPLGQRIHRLQLLRQWVLYFSRILRDHFCSAIFVPFSKKIEGLMEEKHFLDFKKEHENLLNSVCHDCLLDEEKLSPIQITLTELFSTVEKIHELWIGPPLCITDSQLCSLEEQYSSCHRLMGTFLSTLASVRYCPLVEGLAQCLTYNCPA